MATDASLGNDELFCSSDEDQLAGAAEDSTNGENGPNQMAGDNAAADLLRVIFITDTHLGFAENDPIRGNDSFESFEEALKIAADYDVDLILHGGDLFHDNRPSKNTEMKCIDIIRKYTFGNKKLKFKLLNPNYKTNFNDENFLVSYPIFAIHGNHDDRAGAKRVSALDVLHSAGLINLYGSNDNLSVDIHNVPLIINKGKTTVGLYGLGSIRDERLSLLFDENKVTWDQEGADQRFNIFLIHQNHVKHGAHVKYIPESNLPGFLDLVLWGHEHDAYPDPKRNQERGFSVVQPGSSVATQLTHGEARPKHITMFDIVGKSFKAHKVPLKTVRPFLIEDFFHSIHNIAHDDPLIKQKTIDACEKRVKHLIQEAKKTATNNKLPLIRLRVDYTKNGHDNFSNITFGQKFVGLAANPTEIVHFTKNPIKFNKPKRSKPGEVNGETCSYEFTTQEGSSKSAGLIHDLIVGNIQKYGGFKLLDPKKLSESLVEFVDKDENHALANFVDKQLKQASHHFDLALESEEQLKDPAEFFKKNLLTYNSSINADFSVEDLGSQFYNTVESQSSVSNSISVTPANNAEPILLEVVKGKQAPKRASKAKTQSSQPTLSSSISRRRGAAKSSAKQKSLFDIPDI